MKFLFSAVMLFILAVPALAETRHVTVPRNQPAHLSNPHSWLVGQCVPGWVQVFVLLDPNHGEVRLAPVRHAIGDFGGGRLTSGTPGPCVGRIVSGNGLFYVPEDGFVGSDSFRVRLEFEHIPPSELDYVITVE